jgi:hypothetical protein
VAGEAEVADVRPVACDEDVPRLDVAVDEPGAVRGVECAGDLADESDCTFRVEASLLAERLAQVGAVHVRHRQVEQAVILARGQHADDARVVEARGDLRLAQEALAEPLVAAELGREQLQRDALAAGPVGEVDGAHRALAER